MYSVLMMAALTTGGEAPDCHWCRRGDCCGCYGGCYGSAYNCYGWYNGACYGSCYGCYGSHGFWYGCSGCSGCWGGCYGCGGYSGMYSGTYVPSYMAPSGTTPPAQMMPPAKPDTLPAPKTTTPGVTLPNRARVIVELPADAKLFIDDQLMKTTSETRSFNTPALDKDQTYFYDLRAEIVRDGKQISVSKRITLKSGDVVRTRFGETEATEALSTVKARY